MLTISDIVALAKAGYKPSDVKELIELSKTAETPAETPNDKEDGTTVAVTVLPDDPVANTAPATGSEEQDPEDSIDYRALYEETKLQLDSAQQLNVRHNIQSDTEQETDSDIIKDLVKNFM